MDGRILEENTAPQHRRHLAEKTFMLGPIRAAAKGQPFENARTTSCSESAGTGRNIPPHLCGSPLTFTTGRMWSRRPGARGTHAPNGGDLSPRRITDAVKLRAPAAVKLQVRSTGIEESLTPRSTSEPLAVGSVAPSIAEAKSAQLR